MHGTGTKGTCKAGTALASKTNWVLSSPQSAHYCQGKRRTWSTASRRAFPHCRDDISARIRTYGLEVKGGPWAQAIGNRKGKRERVEPFRLEPTNGVERNRSRICRNCSAHLGSPVLYLCPTSSYSPALAMMRGVVCNAGIGAATMPAPGTSALSIRQPVSRTPSVALVLALSFCQHPAQQLPPTIWATTNSKRQAPTA